MEQNIKNAKICLDQYGSAMRGDWSEADGRSIRDALDDISRVLDGKLNTTEFRCRNDLCPDGDGHWTQYCDDCNDDDDS